MGTHPPGCSPRPLKRPIRRRCANGSRRLSQAGVSDFDGWKDIRIGRADEFADAAEILAPIVLNADVRRHDGTTVTQRVSLYGTIRGVSPKAGVAINCVLHKTIKAERFSSGVSECNRPCRRRNETARQISRNRDRNGVGKADANGLASFRRWTAIRRSLISPASSATCYQPATITSCRSRRSRGRQGIAEARE